MLLFCTIDAFFWTIGPLLAESGEFGIFGGFLLVVYTLPVLFMGWFVGGITTKFGKKTIIFAAMILGSLILSLLWFEPHAWLIMTLVLLAAGFFSLAFTSIEGFYADYIAQNRNFEQETQGLIDLFYNLGWIIGPILGGLLSGRVGNLKGFGLLGFFSLAVTLLIVKSLDKRKLKN